MKISSGQEYAAKIINTKKLSARGKSMCQYLVACSNRSGTLPMCGFHSPAQISACTVSDPGLKL